MMLRRNTLYLALQEWLPSDLHTIVSEYEMTSDHWMRCLLSSSWVCFYLSELKTIRLNHCFCVLPHISKLISCFRINPKSCLFVDLVLLPNPVRCYVDCDFCQELDQSITIEILLVNGCQILSDHCFICFFDRRGQEGISIFVAFKDIRGFTVF